MSTRFLTLAHHRNLLAIAALLCCFCMGTTSVSAQFDTTAVDNASARAPFFVRRDVEKLAVYLTKDLSQDDEKVRAISNWIASNVKYSLQAMLRGKQGGSQRPEAVLKRRRAVCQGYSELFEILCEHAGIRAEVIYGYDKGLYWEHKDIFVMDEHAWNSVYFNGEWHLLDLTWYSGSAEMRTQKLRRWLYFHWGLPFKIKYNYVQRITPEYYLPDPHDFAENHLPAQPHWQLNDTIVPIRVFEKDSVEAFFQDPFTYCDSFETEFPFLDSITYFAGAPSPDRFLEIGKSAHYFNPENHLVLGEGEATYANALAQKTLVSLDSWEDKIELYDTAIVYYRNALRSLQDHSKALRTRRKRSFAKNKAVTKQTIAENKQTLKALNKQRQEASKTRQKTKSQRLALKGANSRLAADAARIDPIKIELTTFAKEASHEKTMALLQKDSLLQESKDQLANLADTFDLMKQSVPANWNSFNQHRQAMQRNGEAVYNLHGQRADFREWWTWNNPVFYESLMDTTRHYVQAEQAAYAQYDAAISDTILPTLASFRKIYGLEKKEFKSEMKLIKASKKLDVDGDYDAQYEAACAAHETTIQRYERNNVQRMTELGGEYAAIHLDRKHLRKWMSALKHENKIEYRRNRMYNRHYMTRHVHSKNDLAGMRRSIHKNIVATQRVRAKAKKEFKKEEQELKQQMRNSPPAMASSASK